MSMPGTARFYDVRLDVESWRIHRSIGMDGSMLLASLAEGADDDTRSRLKDLHSHYYKETAPLLRRLPRVRELLEARQAWPPNRLGDVGAG